MMTIQDAIHQPVPPKARAGARRIAQKLQSHLMTRSPRTEVATVVNTDFHQSQGYVSCTVSRGPIQVLGVPYGQVVPGMRIFVRKVSNQGQTAHVYDGKVTPAAPVTSSGSVNQAFGVWPAAASATSFGGTSYGGPYLTLSSGAPVKGWFWSFFFYLSELPKPGHPATLLDMPILNGTHDTVVGGIRFLCNFLAHLGVEVYGNGWGNLAAQTAWTAEPYSPHALWWFNYTLGVGYSVNGAQYTSGNGAINSLGSTMSVGPASQPIGLFLLADSSGGIGTGLGSNGAMAAPAGSWISKIVFGANVSGTTPVSPTPITVNPANSDAVAAAAAAIPANNLELIDLSTVSYGGLKYRCDDSTPGGTTLLDSSGNGLHLTINSGAVQTFGPY